MFLCEPVNSVWEGRTGSVLGLDPKVRNVHKGVIH